MMRRRRAHKVAAAVLKMKIITAVSRHAVKVLHVANLAR
jgi:hypothetical protein